MKMTFVRFSYHPRWAILLALLAILMIVGSACTTSTVPAPAPYPEPQQADTPVIHYLRAQKEVAPSETLRISCGATAENTAIASYEWSATGGQIQGKGDVIAWTAPDTLGEYTITVVVKDDKGSEATSSVTITVTDKPNRPPIIHGVTCPDCTNGTQASKWKTYSIQCDASDPEGDVLSYEWSVTIGKISGEGHLVTWQTFDQSGYAVIMVKVRDNKGNEAEGRLAININCCD